MSDIPLEYFLPLPQANTEGDIVDIRHLPVETAQTLHAFRISDEQLEQLRAQHLEHMCLLHEQVLERYNRAKKKVQIRVRKARSRQAKYPDNLERQQKRLDKVETFIRLRTKAYQHQEQNACNWFPPYYKDGKFDVEALGRTLRSQLHDLIPSFVEEISWINQDGTVTPSPHTVKRNTKDLKKDEDFRALVMDLYEAFFYWCPPQRKEAEVFAEKLSPLQHAMRLRYNTAAENLAVAIINHVVPTLHYTPNDLRYIYPRDKLTKKQRLSVATPAQRSHIRTNTPSEDLKEIRRKTNQAALLGPIG